MGVYKPLRLLQCPDVKNLGLLRLLLTPITGMQRPCGQMVMMERGKMFMRSSDGEA